jgi:hypothetical protein
LFVPTGGPTHVQRFFALLLQHRFLFGGDNLPLY